MRNDLQIAERFNQSAFGHVIGYDLTKRSIMRKGPASKNLQKVQSVITKPFRRESIRPFTEKPSVDPASAKPGNRNDNLNAADLFSLFTADIIREEVLFTR